MIARMAMIVALALTMTGCSDSPSECTATEPCPAGADPSITEVVLDPGGTVNAATGLRVIDQPSVTYTIANRGRTRSDTVIAVIRLDWTIVAMDTIVGLGVGGEVRRARAIPHDPPFEQYDAASGDRRAVNITLAPTDSTDNAANNSATTDSFHIRTPLLEVTVAPVRERTLFVNQPTLLTVTVKNHSQYEAARNLKLRHCLVDFDIGCWYAWTAFGDVAWPDLAPGESHTMTYAATITPTAVEEGIFSYSLGVCVATQNDSAAYFLDGMTRVCGGAGRVTVNPDFEACSPPRLTALPVTLTAPNCGSYPQHPSDSPTSRNWMKYFVFSLDVVAGQRYQITGLGNVGSTRVADREGRNVYDVSANGGVATQTARYYFLNYAASGTRTVSAVVIQ